MDRNHYRKLHGRQGVVERYWHAATHTIPQGKAVMDKRVTGHVHTMSSYPVVGTPREDRKGHMQRLPSTRKGYGRMRGTAAGPQHTSSKGTTVRWNRRQECSDRGTRMGKAEKEPATRTIPHQWTPLAGGNRRQWGSGRERRHKTVTNSPLGVDARADTTGGVL